MNALTLRILNSAAPRLPSVLVESLSTLVQAAHSRITSRSRFRRDAQAAIEPHLAFLIHKRSKFLRPAPGQAARFDRWANELDDFVRRSVWPASVANEIRSMSGRRHLVDLIDRVVGEHQERLRAEDAGLPLTSRFNSHWAD
ncbi:MAG TPA: hypothetical protein VG843_04910 [Rhizomicrobium sp.]|jgi:hypothetical protein|nr:hypothetical protein [Rhizomicrobium sp.]